MKFVLVLVATLAFAGQAVAQHAHGAQKGPNGGPMEDVAGVHAELVTAGNTITINVFDEGNKPLATKGYTGAGARGPRVGARDCEAGTLRRERAEGRCQEAGRRRRGYAHAEDGSRQVRPGQVQTVAGADKFGVLPPPLWGRVGEGGGAVRQHWRHDLATPTPNPSPAGCGLARFRQGNT